MTADWAGSVNFSVGDETATVEYDVKVLDGTTEIPFEFLGKSAGSWAGVNKAEEFDEPREIWEHGIWADYIWVDDVKR